MENKDNNYKTTKTSGSYETRDPRSGWLVGGAVALAAVLGIAYYNNNNEAQDYQNIRPAAGSPAEGSTQMPPSDINNRQ